MTATTPDETALLRVPSGIPGLDTILGGGFIRGGIYIIQGDPGAGKTILANQICFNHVGTGGRALFVTLLAENHARMTSNLRTLSFFDQSKIPDQLAYVSAFGELRDGGVKAVAGVVRREIVRRQCTLLVIDGFISAQTTTANEQAFKLFVHELQEIALATDCTMFLATSAGRGEVSPEQTMVDGLIELSDRLYGWRAESRLHVRKFRGSGFLRGLHAYKITDAGFVVHPRLETLYGRPSRPDEASLERVLSGNATLDIMLGGGLPAASTTMVMGPSGAGKTTLGLHFLAKSSTSETGLLFGFYETPARIFAKADQICRPLRALTESGAVEVLWQPPTDDLLDAYGERLLDAVHRRKVKRLFIDGLTSFLKAAVEPSRIDHFFPALTNELRVLGVTTVYTLEAPDILGPAPRTPIDDVSSLAENMIVLRFVELRSRLYRLISLLKIRDSDYDSSLHEFSITEGGLLIAATADSAETILSRLAAASEGASPPQGNGRSTRGS